MGLWSQGCALGCVPERMCVCVCSFVRSPQFRVHVREHTCDVNKDEPMCSAKFECSVRVCGYVKANVYVIVCDNDAMLEEGNG